MSLSANQNRLIGTLSAGPRKHPELISRCFLSAIKLGERWRHAQRTLLAVLLDFVFKSLFNAFNVQMIFKDAEFLCIQRVCNKDFWLRRLFIGFCRAEIAFERKNVHCSKVQSCCFCENVGVGYLQNSIDMAQVNHSLNIDITSEVEFLWMLINFCAQLIFGRVFSQLRWEQKIGWIKNFFFVR